MNIETIFYTKILKYIYKDQKARQLISKLSEKYEVVFFGGSVRDYILLKHFEPRDFDIVLIDKEKNKVEIDEVLSQVKLCEIYRNFFGGYKVLTDFIEFDIWKMNDTWAFKNKHVEYGLDNLFKTVFLNVDSYAYNYTKMEFVNNCDKNIPKDIDIVLYENPNLTLNIIRAIIYSKKYSIDISDRLLNVLKNEYRNDVSFIPKLMNEQKRHYKKNIVSKTYIDEFIKSNFVPCGIL